MIETMGQDAFKVHVKYETFCDIEIPAFFIWIFNAFLDLYYCSHDCISYPDIDAWERVTRTALSTYEVRLIRRMNVWAADEQKKARDTNE